MIPAWGCPILRKVMNDKQNSDEEYSERISDLIELYDDSSEEDTVEFNVDSSDVTSDTESVRNVNEDSSDK